MKLPLNNYMRIARAVARLSHLNPQVGAVLVNEGDKVVGASCNYMVGADVMHAEVGSIEGKLWPHCVMFVTTQPCMACARAIIRSGIEEVYYQNPWWDKATLSLLEKAGVRILRVPKR